MQICCQNNSLMSSAILEPNRLGEKIQGKQANSVQMVVKLVCVCMFFISSCSFSCVVYRILCLTNCCDSLRHVGCGERQKQRRAQRHSHRHNGLHRAGELQRHRVPADVGRVWVGEQGCRQHQHLRPARVSRPHHSLYKHEVSYAGEGPLIG